MKQRQSKLDQFTAELTEWFGVEKLQLAEAQKRLAERGCHVCLSRLSEWWSARNSQILQDKLLNQITTGARHVKEVESALAKNPAPALQTIIDLHRVLIMRLATRSQAEPELLDLVRGLMKPVLDFARLQQRDAERQLDERKLELMERRAALADQTEATLKEPLTDEQKAARIREIYGLA